MEQNTKKRVTIPGTKLSDNKTQLLISTGVPSFDEIVGGGLPVGTVTLIQEDTYTTYSKLMLRYFLAEGVLSGHSLFFATQELNSTSIINTLPSPITHDESPANITADQEDLKIAWRYKNLPKNPGKVSNKFGHYYDLTKNMDALYIDKADIKLWSYIHNPTMVAHTFANPAYHDLLQSIKNKIDEGGFSLKSNQTSSNRSILRIVLESLGSPMWLPDTPVMRTPAHSRDLDIFLFCLRALVRSAFAVVVVTIPSHIIDEDSVERCIHSSDNTVRLKSFTGTELENNKALSDYHGFFHVIKLAAINSLASKELGPTDYAFKLRRKKFIIEELHLPPELQESSEREQDEIVSLGCGSTTKHLMEF